MNKERGRIRSYLPTHLDRKLMMSSSSSLFFFVNIYVNPLILIPARATNVSQQVEEAEHSQEPEEVVHVTNIQVLGRNPTLLPPTSRGDPRYDCDNQGAEVIPKSHSGKGQGTAKAPHCIRCLIIEKFWLPDECEDLRHPHQEVLRNLQMFSTRSNLVHSHNISLMIAPLISNQEKNHYEDQLTNYHQ